MAKFSETFLVQLCFFFELLCLMSIGFCEKSCKGFIASFELLCLTAFPSFILFVYVFPEYGCGYAKLVVDFIIIYSIYSQY